MHIKQFFVEGLGHSSYLIASDSTHEAAVVDPRRDVEPYLEEAERRGLTIRYALETHNHNDFLSGARALSRRVGAEQVASADAHLQFPYRGVREGDEIQMGEVTIRVLSTPGHTPEHVTYLVVDSSRAEVPVVAFTGGDLLVGGVGRPDLLGKELGERLAPMLYDSLHGKILKLEDYVEVLPTHGSGSLCGKSIGSKTTSTIGYERRFNQALQIEDRDEFVRFVLSGNPGIPTYYGRMRPTNQAGPSDWRLPDPSPLSPAEVHHLAGHGAVVVDTRSPDQFGEGHIPGAVNIGLEEGFTTWAGWLLPSDVPMVLVFGDAIRWDEAVTALARIGYEEIAGYLEGGIAGWRAEGLPLATLEQWSVDQLRCRLEARAVQVLDVRTDSEWEEGHVPGAHHLSLDGLTGDLPDFDPASPIAVICGGGFRSAIGASLLLQRGVHRVVNVTGGMNAWEEAGFPTAVGVVLRAVPDRGERPGERTSSPPEGVSL